MATLSSSSTLDEIKAAYADNASYEEDASPDKARAFITACRLLLLKLPRAAGHGASRVDLSPELIRDELRRAQQWLSVSDAASSNGGVRHLSFECFRD